MHPSRFPTRVLLGIVLAVALLLTACQKPAPAGPAPGTTGSTGAPGSTPAPASDPTQAPPAQNEPQGTLTQEQVDKYTAQLEKATALFDLGGFDEGIALLQAIIDEAPETKDAVQGLLDLMNESHPKNFDVYPYLDDGAEMHDRRLIYLYGDMPPLLLALYEVPTTVSYNAALFSFDPEEWEWTLETIVFPDGCWFVSGIESELRAIGKELVLYAHCDAAAPVTELLIAWATDGGWMGTWNTIAGEAGVAESLDLLKGTRLLEAKSDIETLTMWWDGDDFADDFN